MRRPCCFILRKPADHAALSDIPTRHMEVHAMSRKAMEAKKPVERVAPTAIRLDKFLKISRIIKRRSVANDACSTGHVTVNGKEAKPGTDVRVGDVLGIRFGEKYSEYEILSIAEHAAKQDAADMYRALQ